MYFLKASPSWRTLPLIYLIMMIISWVKLQTQSMRKDSTQAETRCEGRGNLRQGHRGSRAGLSTARHQGTKACLGNWYLIYPNARDKMWLGHIVCVSNPAQRKQAGACAGEKRRGLRAGTSHSFKYQALIKVPCLVCVSYDFLIL